MGYVIIFFIILTYASMLTIIFERNIEELIPISIVEIILIIYLFGIFDKLQLGVEVVQVLTILQLIIIAGRFLLIKNKEDVKNITKKIITPRIICICNFIYK